MSCHRFLIEKMKIVNLGTRMRWRCNLVRWHHTTDILNLDNEFWKKSSVEVREFSQVRSSLCVSIHRPITDLISRTILCSLNIKPYICIIKRHFSIKMCTLLLKQYCYLPINNCLLLPESFSCQHTGKFFLTNKPNCPKKFHMKCNIRYLWIFQT